MRKPTVIRSVAELHAQVMEWRITDPKTVIGFVPTMGALHDGHISLIEASKKAASHTMVSVFVNPTQFAPHEDFSTYPRDEDGDIEKAGWAGADVVFLPDARELYPEGESTRVSVPSLDQDYESAERPHFFTGVATIVAKLLIATSPDKAFFGEKDYQQLQVVKRLAKDLLLPVEIVGCPIQRDPDGLALSSRNKYLTPPQMTVARRLNKVMRSVAQSISSGEPVSIMLHRGIDQLLETGYNQVDYLTLVDSETLEPLTEASRPGRLLVAARIGPVRLLDNWPVAPAPRP